MTLCAAAQLESAFPCDQPMANGNLAIRPLGVPTVTVPTGVMADIGMPVGLTFAGRAYDDSALLRFACAFESTGSKRVVPSRTPPLTRG